MKMAALQSIENAGLAVSVPTLLLRHHSSLAQP